MTWSFSFIKCSYVFFTIWRLVKEKHYYVEEALFVIQGLQSFKTIHFLQIQTDTNGLFIF